MPEKNISTDGQGAGRKSEAAEAEDPIARIMKARSEEARQAQGDASARREQLAEHTKGRVERQLSFHEKQRERWNNFWRR